MTARNDNSRWIALYVLCVGMLMIVLDVTIVNVALPSIQEDLRLLESSLAWVVNAYLIAFGGLLLLAGRLGDLIGRRRIFLAGSRCSRLARFVAGWHRAGVVAGRRALCPGRRRRDDLGGDPRDDRDDVPGGPRAGEGDRRVRVRRLGGRLGGPARGRRPYAVHQLALDLLRQPPDRHCDGASGAAAGPQRAGHRPARGRRRPGCGADHERADAGGLHDREPRRETGLGLGEHAAARGGLDRAAARVPRARGARREPADAAADLPFQAGRSGERDPGRCRSPGCSGCSSSARSTCGACSATTRSKSASRSCP